MTRVRPADRLADVDRHAIRVEAVVVDADNDVAGLARAEALVPISSGDGGLRDQQPRGAKHGDRADAARTPGHGVPPPHTAIRTTYPARVPMATCLRLLFRRLRVRELQVRRHLVEVAQDLLGHRRPRAPGRARGATRLRASPARGRDLPGRASRSRAGQRSRSSRAAGRRPSSAGCARAAPPGSALAGCSSSATDRLPGWRTCSA